MVISLAWRGAVLCHLRHYSDVKDRLPGISVACRLGVFGWRIDGRSLFSVHMPRREFVIETRRGVRLGT